MNTSILDIIQGTVHVTSIVAIAAVLILAFIGTIKPALYKKFLLEYSERKYIVTAGVFICLLSGTTFIATQNTNQQDTPSQTAKPVQEIKPEAPIAAPQTQEVAEIRAEEVIAYEAIPFEKTSVDDPSLDKGESKITATGTDGSRKMTYVVNYEGSKEVSRMLKSTVVTKAPVNEVTAVGSKEAAAAVIDPSPTPAKEEKQSPFFSFNCSYDSRKSNQAKICLRR